MCCDIFLCGLPERGQLGVLGALYRLSLFTLFNGVDAVHHEPVGRIPLLAGIFQGDSALSAAGTYLTQAHLSGAASHHIAEDPGFGAEVADLQIKAATITVESGLKVLFLCELDGELVRR